MSMTMVSRRVIPPSKKKATPKRRMPEPPKREESGEMVGERAKPFAALAVPRKQPPPQTWWQKAMKPAAISLGVVVSCGFAYILFNASGKTSYSGGASASYSGASTSGGGGTTHRGSRAGAYPGSEGAIPPVNLSARTGLTDESFLATAYVRRKVSLPNISGNCVVTGSGSRDVGECLRQQQ